MGFSSTAKPGGSTFDFKPAPLTKMMFVETIACSTCRATMVGSGSDAAGWSIFFLLAVVLGMLGGIGIFMFRMARREKEHFDPSLSDDYVPANPPQSNHPLES
jgi:hypothetical protein